MNIYEGTENYIFISYAHADSDIVLPILDKLDRAGFRIWYDSGIEAGSEWPAYIANHIKSCCIMIFFVSKASVNSKNCRREVNLADSQDKEILVAYLEDAELKHGLDLQLSTNQAIHRNKFFDDNTFIDALSRAKILEICKATTNKTSNTSNLSQKDHSAKRTTPANDPNEENPKTIYEYAEAYYNKKEYEKAFMYYHKAANKGVSSAQYKTGECYYLGKGVAKNYTKAVYWYQKAADLHNIEAIVRLANCYYYGKGINLDYDKAAYWFAIAAENGHPWAKTALSKIKELGLLTSPVHIPSMSEEDVLTAFMFPERGSSKDY